MPPEVRDPARRNGCIIPDDGDTPSSALPARSDRSDATLSEVVRWCAKMYCWVDAPLAVAVYYSRCYVVGWGGTLFFLRLTKEKGGGGCEGSFYCCLRLPQRCCLLVGWRWLTTSLIQCFVLRISMGIARALKKATTCMARMRKTTSTHTVGTTKSMQTPGTIFSAVKRVMTPSTAAKVRTPWAVLAVTTGSSEETSSTKSLGTRATTFSMAG